MFRRRRPRRRLLARRALRRGRQRVEEAERLFEEGRYGEAATAFADLAQGAARRGMMGPAGEGHRQAAMAFLEAEQVDEVVEQVQLSVGAFVRARRPGMWRPHQGRRGRVGGAGSCRVPILRVGGGG